MNAANLATCSRIFLIPVVIVIYFADFQYAHLAAACVFGIASLTDWLDGYLARKLDLTSDFGAFLDPVADKLLIAGVLVMLVSVYPLILAATVIIIAREILVSALREWMASKGARATVAVAFSGKLKTTVQMIAISALLLASDELPLLILQLGYMGTYLAAGLSLWSMGLYFQKAWDVLFPDNKDGT
ncbi:MAG: CDP-diacylglycerol--glycerol-3-phosphate 3-phosphatidyltransferase [Pseudohongiellaceae bacterium]